jgi:hypothetical protein
VKTRILNVLLGEALRAELIKVKSKAKLATKLSVSPQTLGKMINDDWEYITRESIERAADHLDLELAEVFEFVPVEFWSQILTNRCTFLRGAQDEKGNEQDVVIPKADDVATDVIKDYLREHMTEFKYVDHKRDEAELLNRARSENCIVIGSPKSNAATEIILSRFFKAEPFNPSDENRRKIPFGFCWPDITEIVKQSSLTCSTFARNKTRGKAGIAVKGRKGSIHVPADHMSSEAFRALDTEKGKDCGLVFVANKPFGTDCDVKLIVLAGFSGLGTIGAAKALIKDFRYLEPEPHKYVYGVVQCSYSKSANSYRRMFKLAKWKVGTGGRLSIKVKEDTKRDR